MLASCVACSTANSGACCSANYEACLTANYGACSTASSGAYSTPESCATDLTIASCASYSIEPEGTLALTTWNHLDVGA